MTKIEDAFKLLYTRYDHEVCKRIGTEFRLHRGTLLLIQAWSKLDDAGYGILSAEIGKFLTGVKQDEL